MLTLAHPGMRTPAAEPLFAGWRFRLLPLAAALIILIAGIASYALFRGNDDRHNSIPGAVVATPSPDDPVIDSTDPVALSEPYQDHVRMTLTPPVVDAARARVALITGADKAPAVARWLQGDGGLPICRVRGDDTVVVLDAPAAAMLRS